MKTPENQNRVAIIGCEHIGAGNIYSLLQSGTINELVLIDKNCKQLLKEVSEMQHTIPLDNEFQIWAGSYRDTATARIVIITAGEDRRSGETRLDSLNKNANLIRKIMRKLEAENFAGVVLITTNPAEILTQIAQEESGLPAGKVIGSGAILNASQLREILEEKSAAAKLSVEAKDIKGLQTATWCAAQTGVNPMVDFCNPTCPDFGGMLERVRIARSVAQITGRNSYASFAVGSCVNKICEAILGNEQAILPVSALTDGQYGISGVYLNLQCVVGKNGVERIVELPLRETELAELKTSAELHRQIMNKLKNQEALTAKNHF